MKEPEIEKEDLEERKSLKLEASRGISDCSAEHSATFVNLLSCYSTEPNDGTPMASNFSSNLVKILMDFIFRYEGVLVLPNALRMLKHYEKKANTSDGLVDVIWIELPDAYY